MIVIAEIPTSHTEIKKDDTGVVIQSGENSVLGAVAGSTTILVESDRGLAITEVTRNVVAVGRGPNVVISIGAAVPSGTGAGGGTGGGGTGGGGTGVGGTTYPPATGTLLVLNTLATAGVMVYNLNIPLSPTARVILYMNGVITDSMHDGVQLTVLGYTPGEIASDDELKAYY